MDKLNTNDKKYTKNMDTPSSGKTKRRTKNDYDNHYDNHYETRFRRQ
jgi:hypothetical protein